MPRWRATSLLVVLTAAAGALAQPQPGDSLTGVVIRAEHISQLRVAVNAMRAAAALPPATYTDDPLAAGTVVKAAHILELREALTHARHMMMLAGPATTDTTLTVIKAVHHTELRAGTQ